MAKQTKLRPQYAGKESTLFWRKINALKANRDAAYTLGIILQEVEGSLLRQLNRLIEDGSNDEKQNG